ncbi:Flagellar biosynthesis protein flgN [Pseudomonas marincola]|uniref:Flagellar biosynthesis protein FlgN n=1 Tax=Pseudomonas marincola TaxID=437900 RepID=A0A653DXF7_9PSED|nr:flagellar protein FlgN [Pseudomonas marincola]CAE6930117.1 Flagellar biosynthesis protein flgN [Pseudomonas marincola]
MHDTKLLQLINADIITTEQLAELIDREFTALGERDLKQLDSLLSAKTPLLALLDQNAKARSQLLLELGLTADRAGLQSVAANSGVGTDLLTQSEALSLLLERCQAGNLRNGRLIRTSQASTRSMLGILRGNDSAPTLYDSTGGTSRTGQQRPLSQA